jgi:hypothetical protein
VRLLITATLFLLASQTFPSAAQRHYGSSTFPPPPRSLEALWDGSSLVVRATVVGKTASVSHGDHPRMALHQVRLQIEELFKDDVEHHGKQDITVSQMGGAAKDSTGSVIETRVDMRLLTIGDDVVLFLQPWAPEKTFVIAFGPPGAFWIDRASGLAEVPGPLQQLSAFHNSRTIDVLALTSLLRDLRNRR